MNEPLEDSQVILFLRKKAEIHQKHAENLLKAAAGLEGAPTLASPHSKADLSQRPSREDQIRTFVMKSGPLKTSDIIRNTGIPRGTVSSLLKEENGFSKTEDGKWMVVKSN